MVLKVSATFSEHIPIYILLFQNLFEVFEDLDIKWFPAFLAVPLSQKV